MNKIQIFNFSEHSKPVRITFLNNEPWFVAKDICEILGLEWKRGLTGRYPLDQDEVSKALFETNGGRQKLTVVNESGLYFLVFQSKKPEAKKFRKWVTREVLPQIRQTGSYSVGSKRAELLQEKRRCQLDKHKVYQQLMQTPLGRKLAELSKQESEIKKELTKLDYELCGVTYNPQIPFPSPSKNNEL